MNFFSIIFLVIIVVMIFFPLSFFLRKKNSITSKWQAFFPALIVLLLVFYLHFGLSRGFEFVSPDEGIFLQNLKSFEVSKNIFNNHSSGPVVVFFVFWLKTVLGFSAEQLLWLIKLFFAFLVPLVIFAAVERVSNSKEIAFFSMLLAFLSNQFIWPFMEARPELFGVPIFFAVILSIEKFLRSEKPIFLWTATALICCLTAIHFLSMIFSSIVFVFCFIFSKKEKSKSWAICVLLCAISFFAIFSFFGISWDIHFAIRDSLKLGGEYNESQYPYWLKLHVLFDEKIKLSFLVFGITIIPTIVLLLLHWVFKEKIFLIKKTAIGFFEDWRNKIVWPVFLLGIAALAIQGIFFSNEVSSQYGNFFVFLLLQAPNLFFLFLFLVGISKTTMKDKEKNIFYYLLPLLAVAFFAFATSPIVKTGFHNFAIRALGYFVPIASIIALKGFEGINKTKKISAIIVILLACSVVLGTRDPLITNRSGFFEKIEVESYTILTSFLNNNGYYHYENFEFPHQPDDKNLSDSNDFDKIFSSPKRSAYELRK